MGENRAAVDVRQVNNLIDLMEFFAERGRPATLAEIAKHFNWPKSSTFNLLGTLSNRGYLYEPKAKEGYYPAPGWLALAEKIDRAAPVPAELVRFIETLCEKTHETAVLAAISGNRVVFVATKESPQAVRYTAPVGKIVPLCSTATGRALLSQLTEAERQTILRRANFEKYTATTLMSVEAVSQEIEKSMARGYFSGNGEYTADLCGLSMPLKFGARNFAVLVAGPMSRVQHSTAQIAQIMAQEVSALRPQGR
jgi:DNA-binding IclR family transcriptional regulator